MSSSPSDAGSLPKPPAPRRGPVRLHRMMLILPVAALSLLVVGNAVILGTSFALQHLRPPHDVGVTVPGVGKLSMVDHKVWRGAAPSAAGYRNLATSGVTTVIDLRAEHGITADHRAARAAGLEVVHLPVRDGQTPSEDQVDAFVAAVERTDGTVLLHCGAGVGRTGAMAAAYLVATGQATSAEALARNLSVGPPSLEQIAFALTAGRGGVAKAPAPVVAVSRFLDAPRRIWHNVT